MSHGRPAIQTAGNDAFGDGAGQGITAGTADSAGEPAHTEPQYIPPGPAIDTAREEGNCQGAREAELGRAGRQSEKAGARDWKCAGAPGGFGGEIRTAAVPGAAGAHDQFAIEKRVG